jgi:hypothetical protein
LSLGFAYFFHPFFHLELNRALKPSVDSFVHCPNEVIVSSLYSTVNGNQYLCQA